MVEREKKDKDYEKKEKVEEGEKDKEKEEKEEKQRVTVKERDMDTKKEEKVEESEQVEEREKPKGARGGQKSGEGRYEGCGVKIEQIEENKEDTSGCGDKGETAKHRDSRRSWRQGAPGPPPHQEVEGGGHQQEQQENLHAVKMSLQHCSCVYRSVSDMSWRVTENIGVRPSECPQPRGVQNTHGHRDSRFRRFRQTGANIGADAGAGAVCSVHYAVCRVQCVACQR